MKSLSFTFLALISFVLSTDAQLTSTNLPIVIVTTPNAIDGNQQQGNLKIIDNASGTNNITDVPTFEGMIGARIRGNINATKLAYNIETWSSATISLDTSLLKLPSDNDWVLLGSYEDRSLLRNTLAFTLHEKMGRYAPRMIHCELIVNNQYKGVYLFGEKIKRDSLRVDISKLTVSDNFGYEMTGGYILKIDNGNSGGWTSQVAPPYATIGQTIDFLYEYPDANILTNPQKIYIKSYVDSFETAMNSANYQDTIMGWRKFGAVNSFIDFMIMNELSKDFDAYRKNTYLFKSKGTKLRPGPLWGFDVAFKNTTDCNSALTTGWTYELGSVCDTNGKLPAFWWSKLATDVQFMKDLKCRYTEFRKTGNMLDTTSIFYVIDSISTKLNANGALTRNFTAWPIWGVPLVNEPLPMATNHAEEIANIKQFIRERISWLDSQWKTNDCVFAVSVKDIFEEGEVLVYPNPVTDKIIVEFENSHLANQAKIEIINTLGQSVSTTFNTKNEKKVTIQTSNLTAGFYYIKINDFVKKIIIE